MADITLAVAESHQLAPYQTGASRREAKLRTGGDNPGHEFHGNQWTDSGGDAEHARVDEVFKLQDAMVKAAGIPATTRIDAVAMADRRKMKQAIVEKLSGDLAGLSDNPKHFLSGEDLRWSPAKIKSLVQSNIDSWARTSGDHDVDAIALQYAVKDTLGIKDPELHHLEGNPVDAHLHHEAAEAYVKAEYDNTQAFLKANDMEYVSVFRGMRGMHELTEGEQVVNMQPASSWTTDAWTANHFATSRAQDISDDEKGRFVLTTRVPRQRVLSTAVTGRGALPEAEVLLLGGPTKVRVFKAGFGDKLRAIKNSLVGA